ncbi:hypothetical protein H9P43_008664 [Blastocladiella emersonii ATCC 22665]|nr:hypothetical protein H9P43_008664 [Blastocladiella emersonii ATCC 22665]
MPPHARDLPLNLGVLSLPPEPAAKAQNVVAGPLACKLPLPTTGWSVMDQVEQIFAAIPKEQLYSLLLQPNLIVPILYSNEYHKLVNFLANTVNLATVVDLTVYCATWEKRDPQHVERALELFLPETCAALRKHRDLIGPELADKYARIAEALYDIYLVYDDPRMSVGEAMQRLGRASAWLYPEAIPVMYGLTGRAASRTVACVGFQTAQDLIQLIHGYPLLNAQRPPASDDCVPTFNARSGTTNGAEGYISELKRDQGSDGRCLKYATAEDMMRSVRHVEILSELKIMAADERGFDVTPPRNRSSYRNPDLDPEPRALRACSREERLAAIYAAEVPGGAASTRRAPHSHSMFGLAGEGRFNVVPGRDKAQTRRRGKRSKGKHSDTLRMARKGATIEPRIRMVHKSLAKYRYAPY